MNRRTKYEDRPEPARFIVAVGWDGARAKAPLDETGPIG